jgi:choloylglycine hydrolase
MGMRWIRSVLLAGLMVLAAVGHTLACTGITLVAADGSVVRGRTLEFGRPMDSDVILIPRGRAFTGTTPDGKDEGLQWTGTYAAAGANGVGLPIIVDGLNEKGLSGGLFYFPDFASYQEIAASERERTIAPWQLVTWALTSFATVDEVTAALPDIRVGNATLGAWGIVPPAHYVLTDASGKSIVIEYVNGALNVHDNPLGVFTNAPTFDWHMTNLRNYISISPDPQGSLTVDGVDLDPLSTGGNLFGMPGDFSSPSRFVRATIYAKMSPQAATGADAVMQGFHILDQFDIPEGAVPEPKGSEPPYEITEWTTMSDLEALTFYIWTSDNRAIRTLDLTKVDLDGAQIRTFALDQEQTFVDLAAT